MMELTVSASCIVLVTPHLPERPPATCVSASEPTGSDESANVAAMVVLPREVTALPAVPGTLVLMASTTTARRKASIASFSDCATSPLSPLVTMCNSGSASHRVQADACSQHSSLIILRRPHLRCLPHTCCGAGPSAAMKSSATE